MRNNFKRVIIFLLCMALTFTNMIIGKSEQVNAAQPATNLLVNGDFSDGMTGWNTYFYNGNCVSAKINSDYEFDMTINYWDQWSWNNQTDWTKIDWQSILIHKVNLDAGKTYTVQFDAYASENRAIRSNVKYNQGNDSINVSSNTINITTQKQTYKYTFNNNQTREFELQFLFGYIENNGYAVPEGKHDVYISDVYLVEGDGSNIITYPVISGVDDSGEYAVPVNPVVKYNKNYTVVLEFKQNESDTYSVIDYTYGDEITNKGHYRYTVKDIEDSEIKTTKSFVIDPSKIDYSNQYYLIKSRSNGKVLEAYGVKESSSIIQSAYAGRASQLFSLENAGSGQYYIQSLTSGKVIAVNNTSDNGAGLVQQKYTNSSFQKWTKVKAAQGYVSLKNVGSGKVIDVPSASASEGIQITQYENNGSNAQQWDIISVDVKKVLQGEAIPDTSTASTWKVNSIIEPRQNKLTAAGPIYLRWYNNKSIGDIASYEIKFDSEKPVSVAATDGDIMEYEWYNTSVAKHTVVISAVLKNGTKITSDTRTFFVTKKGIGWGSLYRTEDMNLSWYYQWSMEESVGTSKDLQFVPMVWGNWGHDWLNNKDNVKYKQVLGFNEPDFNEQSALTVEDALNAWGDFSNSGLRVGSPCTAIGAYWSKDWFWRFMDGIDADKELKVDFITIHCYVDSGDPDTFIKLIDDTWNKWHKPIWITEFGVAKWGSNDSAAIWNKNTKNANYKVYQFMKKVLPELDKRSYVERYAWFPFDPNDKWGGSSGIFDYDTGKLNELGKLYANSGMPEGYNYVKYIMNPPKQEQTTVKPPQTTTTTTATSSVKKPKKAKIAKISGKKKKLTIKIKKQKNIYGYEISWSKNSKFKKAKKIYVKTSTAKLTNFKKLKKKTKYYFRVRAYKKVGKKKIFGKYSTKKSFVVK